MTTEHALVSRVMESSDWDVSRFSTDDSWECEVDFIRSID